MTIFPTGDPQPYYKIPTFTAPYMPTQAPNTGWICPRCDKSNAPSVTACACSKPKQNQNWKVVEAENQLPPGTELLQG